MRNFYTLYGKYCFGLLFMGFLAVGVFFLFRQIWHQYGVASDGGKTGFLQEQLWEEEPVIDVRSCRFLQNQEVDLASMASARDVNGDDLTAQLIFQDKEGNGLSGYLNTEKPGIYPLTVLVHSSLTGRESRKNIIVLVDGRVSE